jgi:hypothetical protein
MNGCTRVVIIAKGLYSDDPLIEDGVHYLFKQRNDLGQHFTQNLRG